MKETKDIKELNGHTATTDEIILAIPPEAALHMGKDVEEVVELGIKEVKTELIGGPKQKLIGCCKKMCTMENITKKVPIVKWGPKYRMEHFTSDLIAGLTVGLTVIPQGLAYAQIARLPPQYGLYSAFMGCFVYCLLGSSKDVTLGPTAILALLVFTFGTAKSDPVGDPTYAIVLTLMSGIVQLTMGILKLGILVNYISYPVINAFTSAAAITIAVGQLKTVLGLKEVRDQFIYMVYDICSQLPKTRIWDMTMGLTSIVVTLLLKKLRVIQWKDLKTTKYGRGATICILVGRKLLWLIGTGANCVVVIGSAGVVAILESQGINGAVTVAGEIEGGMPHVGIPKFHTSYGENGTRSGVEILGDIGAGLGIVPLLALVESMAVGKVFARANRYKLDPTQELVAIGTANIVSSFFSSIPITGCFSRTVINSQSGVRTPAGGLWTGALVILALCVLTPWFYYIPKAALAAVIIAAVIQMVDFPILRTLWKANKAELFPYAVTFICSLVVGIEYGILIGIGVSVFILLYPIARPKVRYTRTDRILIVTPYQGMNFPASEFIEQKALDRALEDGVQRHIVLDMSSFSDMDYTSVLSIKSLLIDCQLHGTKLILIAGVPRVLRLLAQAELSGLTIMNSVKEAVDELSVPEVEEVPTSVIVEEAEFFMSRL